jgi:serine protease Do
MNKPSSGVSGPLRVLFGILKTLCILAGLPLTLLCLMAATGAFAQSGWIRAIAALVVGLGLPLVLVDRLLPDDRERGRGLPTDVLALFYVAIPLLFAGAAHGLTSGLLAVEGDRLAGAGMGRTAVVAYWLGGVTPTGTPPPPGVTAGPKAAKAAADGGAPDAGKKVATAKKKTDGGAPDAPRGPTRYTPAELFRKCAPSVVNIKVGSGGGTGFVIDDKGTVATNSHVINKASSVEIKLKDGNWVRNVDLLVENEEADLALLELKGVDPKKLPPPLSLGDSDTVAVGEQVVAIGNPLGLEHTLTDGLVSSRRIFKGRKWIQISVPISPGNSGGPLFNMSGEVVGVTTAGFSMWSGAQNLNLAVPINELKKLVKDKYPDRKPIGSDNPQTW